MVIFELSSVDKEHHSRGGSKYGVATEKTIECNKDIIMAISFIVSPLCGASILGSMTALNFYYKKEIIKKINFRTLPIISSKLDSQFFVLYLSIYKMHV